MANSLTSATNISSATTTQRATRKTGRATAVGLVVLLAVVGRAGGLTQSARPILHKVVGVTGEHGSVAYRGDTISMFSDRTIWLQDPRDAHGGPQEKISGAVSIRIKGLQWERVRENLDSSDAYVPALCDPLNQLDITSTHRSLASALPKAARLKAVRQVDGSLIVIYSTSGEPVTYDVRVALLRAMKSGNYSLIQSDPATESGTFCGIQDVADNHYYVLTDEPSGSSDFLGIYAYTVLQ